MRILGIDPGMTRLGLGSVEIVDGVIEFVTHGMIAHPRDPNHTFNQHLNRGIHQITIDLPRMYDLVRPDFIAAEIVPPGRLGMNTELVVAAISSCKVIAHQFGIVWHDIAANTVKKQVTGSGTATKAKVKNAIFDLFDTVEQRHLQLKQEQKQNGEKVVGLPQDVLDAIAIAVAGAKIHGIDKGTEAQGLKGSL